MMRFIAAILALAVIIVACQPAEQPPVVDDFPEEPPAPPAPQPTPEPEPEAPVVEEVTSGLDDVFGPRNASAIITLDDITCNREEGTVSFRFRNTEEKSWQLNQQVSFPAPPDLASVRIMINNYEANRRGGYYRGDNLLFGPSAVFSENCGDIEVLAPGEEVTCTVTNVPLVNSTGFDTGVNEIYIDSIGQGGRVRFTC